MNPMVESVQTSWTKQTKGCQGRNANHSKLASTLISTPQKMGPIEWSDIGPGSFCFDTFVLLKKCSNLATEIHHSHLLKRSEGPDALGYIKRFGEAICVSGNLSFRRGSLPATNIFAPTNGWLQDDPLSFRWWMVVSGKFKLSQLVSG